MTHAEYLEWRAFYDIEPFGEVRGDIQTATLASILVNINRKKGSKAAPVTKFVPAYWKDAKHPTTLREKFRALTANIPAQDDEPKDEPVRRRRGKEGD